MPATRRRLKPPTVMKGDTLSAMTFWHGDLLNDWATRLGRLLDGREGRLRHLGDGGHRDDRRR